MAPEPFSVNAGKLAAYTQLLVVPLMARMSDPLPAVRRAASPAFAALVALLPLVQVRTKDPGPYPEYVIPSALDSGLTTI